jgi:hypothetical protein
MQLIIQSPKVMKEGIYIGAEYYNPMFCFMIMFIFEIPVYIYQR